MEESRKVYNTVVAEKIKAFDPLWNIKRGKSFPHLATDVRPMSRTLSAMNQDITRKHKFLQNPQSPEIRPLEEPAHGAGVLLRRVRRCDIVELQELYCQITIICLLS